MRVKALDTDVGEYTEIKQFSKLNGNATDDVVLSFMEDHAANIWVGFDKGGACSVIGALHGAMELGLKINAVFAMGLAENAIDAKSYKPMDIITSLKGYTVEIDNTDAEGRLILADTFTYVQREFKPKRLIDLATLTGAIRIALGLETAGLFSNDDDFA
jgi:leucyl aminopeptidase